MDLAGIAQREMSWTLQCLLMSNSDKSDKIHPLYSLFLTWKSQSATQNHIWAWAICWHLAGQLQYSSQIVETGAICLEFSPNFLHSLLTSSFSLKFAPLLPQCWATRIFEQWDDCNTRINIGEGETHSSVSRFVTSIVASWIFFSCPGKTNRGRHLLAIHTDIYMCTDLKITLCKFKLVKQD